MSRIPVICGLVAAATFAVAGSAQACALDNKPSAYANGALSVVTRSAPTAASFSWWAHFSFPHVLRVGERVTFRENDAQVRKALPASLRHSRYAWRWRFGDGASEIGDRVSHVYRHPGHYKVSVDVYGTVNGKGEWLTFDAITATVQG